MLNTPAGVPRASPLSFLRPLASSDEEKVLMREDVLSALNDRLWTGDQIAAYKFISGKIDAQTRLTTANDFYEDSSIFPEDEARSLMNTRANKDVDLETWVVVAFIDKYRELNPMLTWSQLGPLLFEFPSFDSGFFRGTTQPTRAGSKPKYERDLEERKSLVGIYVAHHLLHKIGIRGRPLKFVLDVLPRVVENVRTIYATGQGKSLKRVNREELFRRFDLVERQNIAHNVEADTDSEEDDYVPAPVQKRKQLSAQANRKRVSVKEEEEKNSDFDEELMDMTFCNEKKDGTSADRVNSVNIDNTPILLSRFPSISPMSGKRRCITMIESDESAPPAASHSAAVDNGGARSTSFFSDNLKDNLDDLNLDALDIDLQIFDFAN